MLGKRRKTLLSVGKCLMLTDGVVHDPDCEDTKISSESPIVHFSLSKSVQMFVTESGQLLHKGMQSLVCNKPIYFQSLDLLKPLSVWEVDGRVEKTWIYDQNESKVAYALVRDKDSV